MINQKPSPFEKQVRLVRSYVACTCEQAEAVATYCCWAREFGVNSSVFHGVAVVFRGGEKCWCAECRPPAKHGPTPFGFHFVTR